MNLAKLADWLNANNLMDRPFCQFGDDEIEKFIRFVAGEYAGRQPCPLLIDHAHRLIVPANADKQQLKAAIRWIQAMIEWDDTDTSMEGLKDAKSVQHVWDKYQSARGGS